MFNDCLPFSSVWMQYQKEVQKMENESFKTSHRHNRGWKKLAEKRLERSLKQLFLNLVLVLKVQRLQLALQSIYCANISKYLILSTFKMFDGFASRKNRYIKVSSREYRIGSTGNFYLLRGYLCKTKLVWSMLMSLLHYYPTKFKYRRAPSILYPVNFWVGNVSELYKCYRKQHSLWRDHSHLMRYSDMVHNHHTQSPVTELIIRNNSQCGCSGPCTC